MNSYAFQTPRVNLLKPNCIGCEKLVGESDWQEGVFTGWQSSHFSATTTSGHVFSSPQTTHSERITYEGVTEVAVTVCHWCARRAYWRMTLRMMFWQLLVGAILGGLTYYLYAHGIEALSARFPPQADFPVGRVLAWACIYVSSFSLLLSIGFIWWDYRMWRNHPAGSMAVTILLKRLRKGGPPVHWLKKELRRLAGAEPGDYSAFKRRHAEAGYK